MRRLIIFTGNALIGACWVLFCQVNAVKLLVIILIVQIQKHYASDNIHHFPYCHPINDLSGNYVTNRFDQ